MKQCPVCEFAFKCPPVSPDMLLQCYERSGASHWSDDPLLRKFDVIKDTVVRHSNGRKILDIGCFNGALLEYFGSEWSRVGLEPSIAAGNDARRRGVHLLGELWQTWNPSGGLT